MNRLYGDEIPIRISISEGIYFLEKNPGWILESSFYIIQRGQHYKKNYAFPLSRRYFILNNKISLFTNPDSPLKGVRVSTEYQEGV